jgi:hypothetical protein
VNTSTPELGQMLFGQPTESCGVPEFAASMFVGILNQWKRIWWNIHQKPWDYCNGDLGNVHYRRYIYPDDDASDSGPNFWMDGEDELHIRWYKHPGRGMSCNKKWEPAQWVAWHDRVMQALRDHEKQQAPYYESMRAAGLPDSAEKAE